MKLKDVEAIAGLLNFSLDKSFLTPSEIYELLNTAGSIATSSEISLNRTTKSEINKCLEEINDRAKLLRAFIQLSHIQISDYSLSIFGIGDEYKATYDQVIESSEKPVYESNAFEGFRNYGDRQFVKLTHIDYQIRMDKLEDKINAIRKLQNKKWLERRFSDNFDVDNAIRTEFQKAHYSLELWDYRDYLPKRLKDYRDKYNLSYHALAIQVPCPRSYIYKLEHNPPKKINFAYIIKICDVLDCTPDYFLGLTDEFRGIVPYSKLYIEQVKKNEGQIFGDLIEPMVPILFHKEKNYQLHLLTENPYLLWLLVICNEKFSEKKLKALEKILEAMIDEEELG